MKKDRRIPAPHVPDHLAHLAQEPELADAWRLEVQTRKAEAKKLKVLLAYKTRKSDEHKNQHVFTQRAAEKAAIRDAALILGLTESAVRRLLHSAEFLQEKLPATWETYQNGTIDLGRAQRAAQSAQDIAHRDDILPMLDGEVAQRAPGMNQAEVDHSVKQRVPELDADAYSARCARAKAQR